MGKFINRVGQRYNHLTVLSLAGKNQAGRYVWHCRCDCGNELDVVGNILVTGSRKSCGCTKRDAISRAKKGINIKYGTIPLFATEKESLAYLYDVRTDGKIFRKCDGTEVKTSFDTKGYKRVRIWNPQFSKHRDGRKTYKVHRLVAMMYLEDYAEGLEVNHKNGVKSDNSVENLEMVTSSENALHSWRCLNSSLRRQKKKALDIERERNEKILAIRMSDGKTVGEYKGQREAAKAWGVSRETMHRRIMRGKSILKRPRRITGIDFSKEGVYFISSGR